MKSETTITSLPIWNDIISLTKGIYTLARTFPQDEREGLALRLRNKVVDLPMTFTMALNGKGDFSSAQGSLLEIETLLLISAEMGFIKGQDLKEFQDSLEIISLKLNQLDDKMTKSSK